SWRPARSPRRPLSTPCSSALRRACAARLPPSSSGGVPRSSGSSSRRRPEAGRACASRSARTCDSRPESSAARSTRSWSGSAGAGTRCRGPSFACAGRSGSAPGRTAAAAVATVAEALGDRCGALAFDAEIRRAVAPRRAGARHVVGALFDLEPIAVDSDYERAFRELTRPKRAFLLVLTDLIEPSAARSLVEALPVLTRHHAVAVGAVTDPELAALATAEPRSAQDVYRAAVALQVLRARAEA